MSREQPDDVVEAVSGAQLGQRPARALAVVGQGLERAQAQPQVVQTGRRALEREACEPLRRGPVERVVVAHRHEQDDRQGVDEIDAVAELGGRRTDPHEVAATQRRAEPRVGPTLR